MNNFNKKSILVSTVASSILLLSGCGKGPFITVWEVKAPDKNITIPINPNYAGDYNYTINWGDGNISEDVKDSITHTYVNEGNYTVKINGQFPAIYLNNDGQDMEFSYYIGNADKLIEVDQWGDIKWKSFKKAFAGAQKLKIKAIDTPNLKNVKDMSYAFAAVDTNIFNNIEYWDVSNVTNMRGMFAVIGFGVEDFLPGHFNQDIENWNTSNVTDMSDMFRGQIDFNQNIEKWDVSSVTNMSGMFVAALSFNQPLNNWDVSSVTNMSDMFYNAPSFNQPLNNWDVSSVTNMSGMFYNAPSFNQPLNNWDVSSVTNMSGMFYNASSFNQNISNWNVSNVIDYSDFANNCPIDRTSKMPKFK